MSKFNFYFIALASLSILFSCNKSDDADPIPEIVRPYADQYAYDMTVIKTYLKKHYIKEIVNNPGSITDQDIVFAEVDYPDTQQSIWNSPMLDSVKVNKHDMEYTIYYIKLREGSNERPSRADRVLAAYDGSYIFLETRKDTINDIEIKGQVMASTKKFTYILYPEGYLPLHSTIAGWTEIFPLFKSGTMTAEGEGNPNPASFENFGAGVMFIPSGLGYYNNVNVDAQYNVTIPAYAQLMFKFKFYSMKRDDQDQDGILSINEDIDHDGYFNDDDTDGDGIPNYRDADDDGDGRPTKAEITQEDGTTLYSFDKIPDCSGNQTTLNRVKRHLDYDCRLENEGTEEE